MSKITDATHKKLHTGAAGTPVKSGDYWQEITTIPVYFNDPSDLAVKMWWNRAEVKLKVRKDGAHLYEFSPDTISTTTTTTSTSTTTSSSSSTISTTSTVSTISTTTSSSSTVSTTSTLSTTSSTISTTSTVSTISTTTSSSSTVSSTSTVSTTSSSQSSTISSSTSSSTISTTSTISTISTTTSSSTSSSTISSTSTLSTTSSSSTTTSTASTISTTSTAPLCEYNEYFSSTALWLPTGDGTFTIVSSKLRMDIDDNHDYYERGVYQYEIASGDFDIRIDFSSYSPDDTTNGLIVKFQILGDHYSERDMAEIQYQLIGAGTLHSLIGKFVVNNVPDEEVPEYASSRPSLFRIKRVGTRLTSYYYSESAWHSLYSKDFGSRASNLSAIVLKIEDSNTRGGYAEFDNLMFFEGCPSAYPKAWTTTSSTTSSSTTTTSTTTSSTTVSSSSSSTTTTGPEACICQNDAFNDLDYWTITKALGSETATIVSGECRITVPDSGSASINIKNICIMDDTDFEVSIDVSDYTPNLVNFGHALEFEIYSYDSQDIINMYYFDFTGLGGPYLIGYYTDNGSQNYFSADAPSGCPTQFKFIRSGTTMEAWYNDGGWVKLGDHDFSSRISNLVIPRMRVTAPLTYGGSVDVDNFTIV